MNRIFKIVGYAVMLFLVYIGSITMLKSCKSADSDGNNIAQTEDGYTSDEEIYDEFFESDEEETASSEASPEYKPTETDATEYDEDFSFEATESEKNQAKVSAAKTANKPAVKSTSKPSPTSSSTSNASPGGDYLVVAGSYLIRDNAQKMVDKLKKLGYSNAEIVSFDESKYHSISAGRYNSYDSAGDVAKALKKKGIDCYVHTRK